MVVIYDFDDYRTYLQEKIASAPRSGRGLGRKLAEVAGCNPTYISHVLQGRAHLSTEQAFRIGKHFQLSDDEIDFFIQLLALNRAGDHSLESFLRKKIDARRNQRQNIKSRIGQVTELGQLEQLQYFGTWFYSVIHLMLTVPGVHTKKSLVKDTGLSARLVDEVVEFLLKTRLAIQEGEKLSLNGQVTIHLGDDATMVRKHHSQWRVRALDHLDYSNLNQRESFLHYSSVVSVSQSDVPRIREVLIQAIEEVRAKVRKSPAEEIYCYNLDLFPVLKKD